MQILDIIQPLIKKFLPFAQQRMGFSSPPRLFLKSSAENAQNPLGKTAFYDPNEKSITVYTTGRHPKDVMRSISHELVHHSQNCRGEFDKVGSMGDGYAQNDKHLREMEREAYEVGNLCFRDWEDSVKNTTYYEHLQKGDKKMSIKDWKNKEIKSLLAESWGFSMDLSKLTEAQGNTTIDLESSELKNATGTDAAMLRRLSENKGKTVVGEAGDEQELEELAQAKQAGERRKPHRRAVPETDDEEELDEQSKTDRPDRVAGRDTSGRRLDEEEEDAKPDYIDIDGDGDKDESMEDAAADADDDVNESMDELRHSIRDLLETRGLRAYAKGSK